jgi:hypothetical protein
MQSRFEDISESEYDIQTPPPKRQKLSQDPAAVSHTEANYENTNTHGNARAHYGHVYNYITQDRQSAISSALFLVFQDRQSAKLDAACMVKVFSYPREFI